MTTTISTRWSGTYEVTLTGRTVRTAYRSLQGWLDDSEAETFATTKRAEREYARECERCRQAAAKA